MSDGGALDPERWRRIDALFEAMLEYGPEERQAVLAGLDAGERGDLERLLEADEAARTFLESRAGNWLGATAAAPLPAPAEAELPKRIGPYKVLGVIGEGGMGRVLLAARADEQYQRLVAIKTLRGPAAGKPREDPRRAAQRRQELLSRFDLERQALAQLEHPNIARLYDAGRDERGDPYLVLEHIDGVPLDAYCDEQRLDVEARLRLFLEVCTAVQAAHRNLLVHRDLKPSNILVTREGRPMLLDFGIAKLLDPARGVGSKAAGELFETREGSRPMTPGYASPEQIKGEPITTASDVYSLGVVLYELLTGRKPYRVTSWLPHELEKAICEVEPERPSTAVFRPPPAAEGRGPDALAPAEVARRRATSPDALARHLRGDLDTLLSTALRKDPDRRYASVEAMAQDIAAYLEGRPLQARPPSRFYALRKFAARHRFAVAAASGLMALLLFFAGVLLVQGRQIRAERDKAEQALAFLIEVFKASEPTRTQGEELKARDILDGAAHRVEQELAGQPEIQATLMDAMGQVYLSLGLYAEARDLFARALPLRVAARGEPDPETLATRGRLGRTLVALQDWRGARSELEQALAGRPEGAPEDEELVALLDALAEVGTYDDRRDEVLALRRRAAGILEQSGAPYQKRLAAKARLVRGLLEAHQFAELDVRLAELSRETGGLIDSLPQSESLETAATVLELANQLWEFGDDRAEGLFRRAIEIRAKWLDETHPDLVTARRRLAFVAYFEERFDEALALNQEIYATLLAKLGPEDRQTLLHGYNLAISLWKVGRPAEGLPRIRQVRDYLERHPEIKVPRLSNVYISESGMLGVLGDFPAAERCLILARQIFAKGGDPTNDEGQLEMAYANLRRAQKNPQEAREHFARALEIRRARVGDEDWTYTYLRAEYADILAELGRFAEAEKEAQASYDALRATYGPRTVMVKKPLRSLLAVYQKEGRDADAARIREALADFRRRPAKLGP